MSSSRHLATETSDFKNSIRSSLKFLNALWPAITGNFILLLITTSCFAQHEVTKGDSVELVKQIDIFDVIRKWAKKPEITKIDTPKQGKRNLSLLPIVGYSPENGAVIGAAISITQFLGNPKSTQLSTLLTNISITTKSQIILNFKFDIYTADNKWYISGDNRLLLFNQPTYGLGINGLYNQSYSLNFNGLSASGNTLEQPLAYDYLRLNETFLRKVANNWYAGMGVMIDHHYKIQDESLKLDSPVNLTSHYNYSKIYGFNPEHYTENGLSFEIMHDSRDNPVNAYSGTYFNVSFRVNPTLIGSSKNSTVLSYEYRTYIGVNKDIPRNLIAFWLWGASVKSGHVPYLDLPAIGWDTYSRSGRGYIQGRFRGNTMLYAESEYRFRLSNNGLFGGVAFLNATTASNPLPYAKQPLFNSVAPGYGVGLRIKMNKTDRTNISADYGRGYGFSGIYLNIREAF